MRAAVTAIALAATLALSLAACSSSTPPESGSAGSARSGSTTGTGSGDSGTSGTKLPDSIDVCALLPTATVAQITGEPFTNGETQNTPSYQLFACDYTASSADLNVSVLGLDAGPGYDGDMQSYQAAGGTITTISGLGDKAFMVTLAAGDIGQVDALFGNVLITASGQTTLTADQAKQLITTLHDKL